MIAHPHARHLMALAMGCAIASFLASTDVRAAEAKGQNDNGQAVDDQAPDNPESDGFGPRPGIDDGPGPRRRGFDPDGDRRGPRGEGRGPRFGRPGMMLWSRMSDQEHEQVQSFMAEHFPDQYADLAELQNTNERLYQRRVNRIVPEMLRLMDLSEDDPDLFALDVDELKSRLQLRELVRQYRFAKDDEAKTDLAAQIRTVVEKQFDTRQQHMELDMNRLDGKLQRLRDDLEQRAKNREAEIDRALNHILSGDPPDPEMRERMREHAGERIRDRMKDRIDRRRGPRHRDRYPDRAPKDPPDDE